MIEKIVSLWGVNICGTEEMFDLGRHDMLITAEESKRRHRDAEELAEYVMQLKNIHASCFPAEVCYRCGKCGKTVRKKEDIIGCCDTFVKQEKRMCCCIPDQNKLEEGCGAEAMYEIWWGNAPDDFTDSCSEHLERMLDGEHKRFEIVRINES